MYQNRTLKGTTAVTKLTAPSDRRHGTRLDATASAPILLTEYSFPGKREPHRVLRNQPEALNPSTRNWKLETGNCLPSLLSHPLPQPLLLLIRPVPAIQPDKH